MLNKITIDNKRTFATEANVEKALDKMPNLRAENLRYFIMRNAEGRYLPVFIGEEAIRARVHFYFNVVG